MFIHQRSRAVLIKKQYYRDADQILTFYTKDFGKIKLKGRGIRKPKSKLRNSTELFCVSEIEFIQGKFFKILTDIHLTDIFRVNERGLSSISLMYKISEILDKLVGGQEQDEKIWNLLLKTVKLSKSEKDNSHKMAYYYFLWNLFSFLGYHPSVYNCASCQNSLEKNNFYFSAKEGGVLCSKCIDKDRNACRITVRTIEFLRLALKGYDELKEKYINKDLSKNIENVSDFYLKHILEN